MSEKVYNFIRSVLVFVGGIFITKGVIDEQTLTEVIGAIMTLIGFLWTFIKENKNGTEEETGGGE